MPRNSFGGVLAFAPVILLVAQPWLACLASAHLSSDAFILVSIFVPAATIVYIWLAVQRGLKTLKDSVMDASKKRDSPIDYMNMGLSLWRIYCETTKPRESAPARESAPVPAPARESAPVPAPARESAPARSRASALNDLIRNDDVALSGRRAGENAAVGPTIPLDGYGVGVIDPTIPAGVTGPTCSCGNKSCQT